MSQPNGWALRRAGWAPHARGRVAAAVAGLVVTAGVAAVTFAPTANAASGCQVSYTTSSWSGGFTANISITNLGSPITSWTLGFTLPGGEAAGQGWSATFSQSGQAVIATNVSYNGSLATNASTSIGFNGTFSGATYPGDPTTFTLNGTACNGGVATPGPTATGAPTPSDTSRPSASPTPSAGSTAPAVQNDVFWKDTSGDRSTRRAAAC